MTVRLSGVRIPLPPPRKNVYFAKQNITFNAAVAPKLHMFFYVYILRSLKNESFYIGYSTDLKKRIKQHNNGENQSTKPFRPYKLIFYEAFLNEKDAKNREKYLKGGYGRRSIQKMLMNYIKR